MHTTPEKKEDALELTNAVASMDSSEESNRAMSVLGKAMYSVCYMYDTDVCGLEELNEAGAGGEPVDSVEVLLCDPHYNLRRQSELGNASYDVFEANYM